MANASDQRAPDAEQPGLDLPEDHGRKPAGMRVRFRGAGERTIRSHVAGERVVFIVEGVRGDAAHKQTKKFGLLYDEVFALDEVFELDADTGRDLLIGFRQRYRQDDDARKGVAPLFDRPAPRRIGWLDEHGRLISDEDLAELRGDDTPPSDAELAEQEAVAATAEEDAAAHVQAVAPSWLRAAADGDTEGYDQLTVEQIGRAVGFIDDLSVLLACEKYEAANRNRVGVRRALDARATELADRDDDGE